MKKQKNLFISIVLIIIQFSVLVLDALFHVSFFQMTTDIWFFASGLVLIFFSVLSLIKKESQAGIILIGIEVFFMLLIMMGHGG